MFLFEFKNTHIGHIPSLIDQYRSKIKFDNQTFYDNDIVVGGGTIDCVL